MLNSASEIHKFGTSLWYDNISRDILESGELKRLINEWGVRGITSNPTIFDNAIRNSSTYDSAIRNAKSSGLSTEKIFEEVAIEDIKNAADQLRPIFDSSEGVDGFVSIEVSPLLARDFEKTVSEAKHLFSRLKRPNIMIKVPGTKEGILAIKELLIQGININVTLLFSVENYIEVAKAYIDALKVRDSRGLSNQDLRSVASFFVSRVDTRLDSELEKIAEKSSSDSAKKEILDLRGKFGIANSKIAYSKFSELFSKDFEVLRKKGAKVQRPLWASTGVKNPSYRDVMYVEELIGKETVNTVPHQTLEAFVDHGEVRKTLESGLSEALELEKKLKNLGIDIEGHLKYLQDDGVKKFEDSFKALSLAIEKKGS